MTRFSKARGRIIFYILVFTLHIVNLTLRIAHYISFLEKRVLKVLYLTTFSIKFALECVHKIKIFDNSLICFIKIKTHI